MRVLIIIKSKNRAGHLKVNDQIDSWDDTTMLLDVAYTPHGDVVVGSTTNDDGTGYDDVAGDGLFIGLSSNTGIEGSYIFKVRASGNNTEARPYSGESS